VTSADGSTRAVAGIYLFKADRCQKCLFYAPAVLLDAVFEGAEMPRKLAGRMVVELAYQHTDIDKKGKATDQTVVSRAVVTALHLQLVQPSHLPLGTKLLQWDPLLEA
ncbi:unnamed protein product, partial [Symbiodinium pilosum]